MSIKYAEVTIIRDLEKESFISYYLVRKLLNRESRFTDNDTIIILFDDETIYDTNKYIIDKKIVFHESTINNFPIWFDLNKDTSVFYKYPTETKDKKSLNFKPLTNNYKNQHMIEWLPSFYNVIYECNGTDIFCILKMKSNEDKPRFLVAYDANYFDKSDVTYLVNCMLKEKISDE